MQPFDYIEEANRTMSSNFHEGIPAKLVAAGLNDIASNIRSMDAIKKFMFYGKENFRLGQIIELARQSRPAEECADIDFAKLVPSKSREDAIRIFHGIIGIITEAGELAEALGKAIETGTELDLVNIAEELGDHQWYAAADLRAMGLTFEQIHRQNIAKLRLRFPDKFTEHDANNRDLAAERELLERKPLEQLFTEHEKEIASKAGGLASPRKPVVRIKGWHIVGNALFGTALDHPRAPGGGESDIRSSTIIRHDLEHNEVETQNTIYKLL